VVSGGRRHLGNQTYDVRVSCTVGGRQRRELRTNPLGQRFVPEPFEETKDLLEPLDPLGCATEVQEDLRLGLERSNLPDHVAARLAHLDAAPVVGERLVGPTVRGEHVADVRQRIPLTDAVAELLA